MSAQPDSRRVWPVAAVAVGAVLALAVVSRALGPDQPVPPPTPAPGTTEPTPLAERSPGGPGVTPTEHPRPLSPEALAALGLPVLRAQTGRGQPVVAVTDSQSLTHLVGNRARQWPLPDAGAGDPLHRLAVRGHFLVVHGRTQTWRHRLSGGARSLGHSFMFLPSARSDAVWLVRRGGAGYELAETLMSGEVRRNVTLPRGNWPVADTSLGLLVTTERGHGLWDADRHMTEDLDPLDGGLLLHAHGRTVAWCDGACDTLRVRDLRSAREHTATSARGFWWAGVSPDQRRVAAIAGQPHQSEMVIVDTATGRVIKLEHPSLALRNGPPAWSPDGSLLVVPLAEGLFVAWDAREPNVPLWRVALPRIHRDWQHIALLGP